MHNLHEDNDGCLTGEGGGGGLIRVRFIAAGGTGGNGLLGPGSGRVM